jgi:hypothetical protein
MIFPRVPIERSWGIKEQKAGRKDTMVIIMIRLLDDAFLCPDDFARHLTESKQFFGCQRKARAPERWPGSSGNGLDDQFKVEGFSCEVWSFSCLFN